MRKGTLIVLILGVWGFGNVFAQGVPQQLLTDVVYLSSDYLEGRATGTPGEEKAAAYIAARFASLGLEALNGQGYLQNFTFSKPTNPHTSSGGGQAEQVEGRNVVGYIDNKAKQTVVIGAHYDHLGYGEGGSLHAGEPAIHNGADDNASGVSAMLYIAEKLNKTKGKQRNNYLFIAFSGEEMGLQGSKYYVSHPLKPLEEINYVLNMDMVGRLNEEKVLVVNGVGTSPVWKQTLEKSAGNNLSLKTAESGIGPSDHTSFYLKDIPVLHFFSGQHTDYHKPEDDASLLNFEGIVAISDFIYDIIQQLNDKGRIEFTKTTDESSEQGTPRFKVTLGVLPDYTYQGEGMRIDGVLEGRTAANAGLQDGDVVVQIGETKVIDIYSYMGALSAYTKGDKATVVVKRKEEKVKVEVEF